MLRRHLIALEQQTPALAGIDQRCFIDIDSLLRPVYGHAKQGRLVRAHENLRQDRAAPGPIPAGGDHLHPGPAPVVAGVRLRAGRAGSAKGTASMLVETINTAVAAGADPATILVRGDSAYCAGKAVAAVGAAGAAFSFAIARNPAVDTAI